MSKLILIANRLPITLERTDDHIEYKRSVGGLATGMASLSESFVCIWVGFSGIPSSILSPHQAAEIDSTLRKDYNSISVPLTSQEVACYYEGFSNETLWPLFHYFPLYTRFDSSNWECYQAVNQKFADAVLQVYEEGDLIWVHDYQLSLVPAMLRKTIPSARIGFFLHIPFPTYEILRLLPWRNEILEGILGADLIGFHTPSYVQHFLDCVHHLLGHENVFGEIRLPLRMLKVDAFPMGIDFDMYQQSTLSPEVKVHMKNFKQGLANCRILLSIDRLDYSKGLLERLACYQLFLDRYPDYRRKLIWIIIAVPSRTNVTAYEHLNSSVNELVGRINGAFGDVNWAPIHYINRGIDFNEICALYAISEIALVTPLRDGMNLVAKEFVATQKGDEGVLILSEMAGVAEEFGEAMIVNPHNWVLVADTIHHALSMPIAERRKRIQIMQQRLKKHDVFWWAQSFTTQLSSLQTNENRAKVNVLAPAIQSTIKAAYQKAHRRLLLLDYDGTLVPFKDKPEGLSATNHPVAVVKELLSKLNVVDKLKEFGDTWSLLDLLKRLCKDPNNHVVMISGRTREFLDSKFGDLPLSLVAEHGGWVKQLQATDWTTSTEIVDNWKSYIRPLFQLYTERTPGSLIEEKTFSLAWHYRMVKGLMAETRVRELKRNLLATVANMNLKVQEGSKVLEVKNAEIDKGRAVQRILLNTNYDFVLAMGDDHTDEDMFEKVPSTGFCIKIGEAPTRAAYRLNNYSSVRDFLESLSDGRPP